MKIRPLEEDFINWYENGFNKFTRKFHRFLFPNCKRCKSMKLAYKKLKKMKGTNLAGDEPK